VSAQDETETEDKKATDDGKADSTKNEKANKAEDTDTSPDDDDVEIRLKPSSDAKSSVLFVRPTQASELPAGTPVKVLVGFFNKGEQDFTIDTIDAALHYPLDYTYYIQNFTTIRYSHVVEPGREGTFEYGFTPSDTLSSRPFGLTINLNYHNADGEKFLDTLFNSTINITELDTGFDTETFFLYVVVAAILALVGFALYQSLVTFGKRRLGSSKPRTQQIETGTQANKTDVDYDWLPQSTLDSLSKAPSRSSSPKAKTSPRLRAAAASKRRSGDD
jgi:translocon-associated protein subunit alpha